MGNDFKPQVKSVKGLSVCPHASIFRSHTDHPDEEDICDHCGDLKLCRVRCESPKSFMLHRICHDCLLSRREALKEIDKVMGWTLAKEDENSPSW